MCKHVNVQFLLLIHNNVFKVILLVFIQALPSLVMMFTQLILQRSHSDHFTYLRAM